MTVKRHASVMSMHVLYYSLWRSPGESTTRTVCKIYKSIREKDLPLCNHTYILVLFVSQRSICLKYEVQPCTRVLRWRCTRVLVLIWRSGSFRNDDPYCTFSTYTPINNVDLDVGRYLGPSYSTHPPTWGVTRRGDESCTESTLEVAVCRGEQQLIFL